MKTWLKVCVAIFDADVEVIKQATKYWLLTSGNNSNSDWWINNSFNEHWARELFLLNEYQPTILFPNTLIKFWSLALLIQPTLLIKLSSSIGIQCSRSTIKFNK